LRIAVECKSPLLQKALEIFLEGHLASSKNCDILVCDVECFAGDDRCFYISQDESADLVKPFSKTKLILALEARYKKIQNKSDKVLSSSNNLDFSILEKRIDLLTQEYKENIIRAVKAFYE
jgi:DNA-binding ferritin-like protein (Dps family)